MVFGDGAFGSNEEGALINGINALTKETPESSLDMSPCEHIERRWPSANWAAGPYETRNLPRP